MKKSYIIVFFILFSFVLVSYILISYKKDDVLQVKETYSSLQVASNSYLKEVNEEDEKSKMLIYYPETKYETLNEEIKNIIKDYVEDFRYQIQNTNTDMPRKCELSVNFDSYEYKDYISYVFYISVDILAAHPDCYIETINYDFNKNKIITIQDLVSENNNVLNILSNYCYEELSQDKSIVEYGNLDQLKLGTSPDFENFEDIAFTKTGLTVFFEKYSVGPYVLGEFSVLVPYEKII